MTKFGRSLIYTFLGVQLSGCAILDIGPSYDGPTAEESLTQETEALNAPANWVLGPEADGEIATAWSAILSDPFLDTYIEAALKNNPSLRSSAENVVRSEAILRQARSDLFPNIGTNLSGGGGGLLEGGGGFSDNYSGGVNAGWEVDLWGGIKSGILTSKYDLESTRATYLSARQALIAAVAQAYVISIEADKLIALNELTLAAQVEVLRIVDIRYELGAASRRELVLAESDVANVRDNLVLIQSAKREADKSLETLLGEYPDANIDVSADFPAISDSFSAGAPAELLRRRPDVIASEFAVLSAFQATRTAKADAWPRLSLSGGLNTGSPNLFDLLNPTSLAYSLGAQLTDTLFDGGFSEARIEVASANQRQALANYGSTVLDAYFEVETALDDIRTLEQRAPFVAKSADAARETVALAEIQYKEGDIDLIDVLTFRQRSFQADSTEITLNRQIIQARISLYLALGGASHDSQSDFP